MSGTHTSRRFGRRIGPVSLPRTPPNKARVLEKVAVTDTVTGATAEANQTAGGQA